MTTTAEHVAAVEAAIEQAGGPDRIRFAPVAIEGIAKYGGEGCADGPCMVWCSTRDDALVEVNLKRVEPAWLEHAEVGPGGIMLAGDEGNAGGAEAE
jgi:hypothetical protein